MLNLRKSTTALAFIVISSMTLACTAPGDKNAGADISAPLADIPPDAKGRFILTVAEQENGGVAKDAMKRVVSVLQKHGAEKIEPIGKTRILIVTSNTAPIYAVIESGLISSVQVDRVSKTQPGKP